MLTSRSYGSPNNLSIIIDFQHGAHPLLHLGIRSSRRPRPRMPPPRPNDTPTASQAPHRIRPLMTRRAVIVVVIAVTAADVRQVPVLRPIVRRSRGIEAPSPLASVDDDRVVEYRRG